MIRKSVMVVVLALAVCMAAGSVAFGASAHYATVNRIGGSGGSSTLYFKMTEVVAEGATPSWTGEKWFTVSGTDQNVKKEDLAILLTALSANKQVQIIVDDITIDYPVILTLYVTNTANP